MGYRFSDYRIFSRDSGWTCLDLASQFFYFTDAMIDSLLNKNEGFPSIKVSNSSINFEPLYDFVLNILPAFLFTFLEFLLFSFSSSPDHFREHRGIFLGRK
jgi:hypothetical protein